MFEKEIISLLQTHFCVFVLIFFFIHHLWSVVDLWVLLSCCFFTLHEEQFLLYSTAIVLSLPLRLLSNGISVWWNLLRRHGPVGFLPSRWGHGLSVFMGLHDVALPTLAIGPAFLFPPFGNRRKPPVTPSQCLRTSLKGQVAFSVKSYLRDGRSLWLCFNSTKTH